MENQWDSLTDRQHTILSATDKIAKMEGVFIGWYYAALMSDNKAAAQVAYDMKTEASVALKQVIEIANADLTGKQKPEKGDSDV